MLTVISPAKTLDFEEKTQIGKASMPRFLQDAESVNRKLKKQSRAKLMELQSISRQLAELNYQRNQQWELDDHDGGKQAALSFKGDVYQGMEAQNWNEEDMEYAAEHLIILSGLYGILRPTDKILPYRLEMGTSLAVGRRKDLYHYWQDKLPKIFKEEELQNELILNLASKEYFKALEVSGLKNPVLDVEFLDRAKNGDFKIISFHAKKARGMMANFVIRNRIEEPEQLKAFDTGGYYFDVNRSTDKKYVFLRD